MPKKNCSNDNHIRTRKDMSDHIVLQSQSNIELLNEIENMMASEPGKMNTDKIEQYLALLQKRAPVMEDYNPNDGWEQLKEDHFVLFDEEIPGEAAVKVKDNSFRPRSGRKIIRIVRVGEIAAVLVLGLVIAASAFGFNPVRSFLKWTQGVVQMYSDPSGTMELPVDDLSEFHSLKEALAANGIDYSNCPNWVPSDYSLSDVNVRDASGIVRYTAIYEASRGELLIRVTNYLGDMDWTTTEEREEGGYTYTQNNRDYNIITNYELSEAIWREGQCVYTISGQITDDELKDMINSIT